MQCGGQRKGNNTRLLLIDTDIAIVFRAQKSGKTSQVPVNILVLMVNIGTDTKSENPCFCVPLMFFLCVYVSNK